MPIKPEIGASAGQQYDVARAIQTFLGQMAEGGIGVAAAVIKELLQNADDAGATEISIVLDERIPPADLLDSYRPLLSPAILVRNNRPFKLKSEVGENETDDFSAICDVASGHKRADTSERTQQQRDDLESDSTAFTSYQILPCYSPAAKYMYSIYCTEFLKATVGVFLSMSFLVEQDQSLGR